MPQSLLAQMDRAALPRAVVGAAEILAFHLHGVLHAVGRRGDHVHAVEHAEAVLQGERGLEVLQREVQVADDLAVGRDVLHDERHVPVAAAVVCGRAATPCADEGGRFEGDELRAALRLSGRREADERGESDESDAMEQSLQHGKSSCGLKRERCTNCSIFEADVNNRGKTMKIKGI